MTTVLFATSTAILFGVADFLGGMASRIASAMAVTARAHSLGVVLLGAFLLVSPMGSANPADLWWGASAGVCGGLGVVALYAALARGRMSIVAPITAALSGSLPAAYDLLRGSTVGPVGIAGLVLALVAVVIVSMAPSDTSVDADGHDIHSLPPAALALALLAGIGFAGAFISFSFTRDTSGLWPLFSARITSATLLVALTFARVGSVRLVAGARGSAFAAGVLDIVANVTMLVSIRIGPLAVAAVLGSLYPVVTILLARIVLGERLRTLQRAGVALALVAVVLTALP